MASKKIVSQYFVREVPNKKEYQERLDEEFYLIDKFHFTHVFQQVYRILEIAKRLNIPHIIRGSAGSSLVCFQMGITQIDPILYNLELARFMNEGRQDLPDIDIDVPYNRRNELYAEIAKTWPKMVARISNHVSYGAKVALREYAKEVLLESYPPHALQDDQQRKTLKRLQRKQFQLSKLLTKDQEEKAKEMAVKKTGTFKHYSKHCGGIVIFEEEGCIPKELSLETEDSTLEQIRLNKDETEEAGYIKIDVLSNRGLAQLVEAQTEPRDLLDYPVRDTKTEQLFAQGDNLGITFGESRGMRKLFLGIKPRFMEDIAIVLALIRPAAATKGRKAEFLDRWKYGFEDVKSPEYRQIIYDDDAISLVRDVLSCTSSDADKWRKVFAKQNPAGRIQFRKLMYAKGIAKSTQDHIMEELDYLALYSFCKSHAISYAQLVWALGYEKAHHPHRIWCAALNHCHSEFRKWVHYREARCSGLLLTRQRPPYRVGTRKGQPALIPIQNTGEQQLVSDMFAKKPTTHSQQAIGDMKRLGYWLSEEFLPSCGIWSSAQQTLHNWFGTHQEQHQTSVRFRGIIATGRILRRDGLVTLLTIGVDNKRYIDLVYPDVARDDLLKWSVVEGKGKYEKKGLIETIQIESIRGVSLDSLFVE
jgi:DNA polymerase III alpha subunit